MELKGGASCLELERCWSSFSGSQGLEFMELRGGASCLELERFEGWLYLVPWRVDDTEVSIVGESAVVELTAARLRCNTAGGSAAA